MVQHRFQCIVAAIVHVRKSQLHVAQAGHLEHEPVLFAAGDEIAAKDELLHGAPVVKGLLANELRTLLLEKAAVVQAWVDAKRMAKVDGMHLFFTIWAATQTYADFDVQICAVLEQDALTYDRPAVLAGLG